MVLAHGSILQAPTLAVIVDELRSLAGEEQGFLVVLLADVDNKQEVNRQVKREATTVKLNQLV